MNRIRYFNIEWASKHDGPGNRVVVFLQGCNLSCTWCHSPHSQAAISPLLFYRNLCTHCNRCASACAQGAHSFLLGIHTVNPSLCIQCGSCVDVCPVSSVHKGGALCLPTKEVDVTQLFREIEPQLKLLKSVTFSGGEPLLQAKPLVVLAKLCKEQGYHVAVETSGVVDIANVRPLLPYVDCWLVGIRLLQGYGKGVVPQMEQAVIQFIQEIRFHSKTPIIARIPIIPSVTDSAEYLERVKAIVDRYKIDEVDMLRHNPESDHFYNATSQKPSIIYDEELADAAFDFASKILM